MKTRLRVLIVATVLIKAFALLPLASAELNVTCDDYSFTDEKLTDCQYVLGSDLTDDEKLGLLDILNSGEYSYESSPIQPIYIPNLSIQTDYPAYKPGDTIKVEICPKDVLISVSYGDTTKLVRNGTTFTAVDGITAITASHNGETFVRNINVRNDPLLLAWKIILFAFLNYFTFSLSKSSLIAKWLSVVS